MEIATQTQPSPTRRMRSKGVIGIVVVLLLGAALLLRGRVTSSLEVSNHLDRGAQALTQNRPQEAEQAWKEAARLAPTNPNPYRALGTLYLAQGRMPEARDAFNRLAEVAPQEPHVLCELARAELSGLPDAMYEATARDALRAAQLEPTCVQAQTVAGEALIRKGDYKQGLEFLRKAVQLKPEDVPLRMNLINKMLETSDAAGVQAEARALIQRYPGYAQAYVLLGTLCDLFPPGSAEAQEGEKALQTALRLEPTNAVAHAKLGILAVKAGEGKKAIPHLQAAQLLGYRKSSILFNLSQAYRLTGETVASERYRTLFLRISQLENEVSALEKQSAQNPENADLKRRLAATNAALTAAEKGGKP